ncbi:MAG: tRNA (N(6)-L-threonylcarbamoyladenosine(37)-C(2))-methylthiotransferase MtaB [Sphingobacteriales bacterium]|nr:MAG: tRNA (N(6)-L-threonylcarbamoyladenosine(37)-C(2))-methylthiotransferase MtaB [Sphingobacteriales bacterium]
MNEILPSVAFHTLGCKLNFSESSALSRQLETQGFPKKAFEEAADVYVLNTCSVTENADKECRMLVRRIQRRAPEALVVVTGCYAQLKPQEIIAIPGVDLVLGAAEKFQLSAHLRTLSKGAARVACNEIGAVEGFHAAHSEGDRTRTFLKVQDGCDYTCSFCTIPQARGHSRSDTVANVVDRVQQIAETGAKEVVLTGINLGDFGKGTEGGKRREENFYELIEQLDGLSGIERYRISSIEPNLLTDEIIRFVASSKRFMPHFHIPLQSGSNAILASMRRRYRRELYAERIETIKTLMPHAGIGADVIVGFPSESEVHFQETYEFLNSLPVSYLHVFTYSERANTDALAIRPVVPVPVRHDRNKALRVLSLEKQTAFAASFSGTERPVLWEKSSKGGIMHGYTDNYIAAETLYDPAKAGTIERWRL